MDETLGICAEVRKDREGALPYWRPLYEAREKLGAFLDGERYEHDNDLYNRDRRRQQFRGQEITNVNRHKAAQATAQQRSLSAEAVDSKSDPEDGEMAVAILEWEHKHPQKCYEETIEEVVQDAIDTRAGCAMLHFDPDLGEWGETFWQWKNANLIMWEPGFANPHHLKCGWMHDARRMHIDEVKKMGKLKGKAKWNIPTDLRPDGEVISRRQGATNPDGSPRLDTDNGTDLLGVPGPEMDDKHIWVLWCWYKNDPSYSKMKKDEGAIPDGQRYMLCDNPDCGAEQNQPAYRSDTQDELIAAGKIENALPDGIDGCPQCGDHMTRMDRRVSEQDLLVYPSGRRLVIMPLLQDGGNDEEPWYDGEWPVPTARSFPIMWVTAYGKGGRPMGDCDTDRNWDAQLASDQLLTMAFDRIMQHQRYYVMPDRGINDAVGNRFEFRDDQFNVMFRDLSDTMSPSPMPDTIEGSALDASWPTYWNAVQQTLLSHQGIADLGLTPESSKNIAGVAIAQLNQMGEIPVEHFKRRMNRAFAQSAGVHWDYIRATYTRARLARLSIEDESIVVRLRGDELPNFDFVISINPPFTGLEKERTEAFQALFTLAQQVMAGAVPFEAIALFADVNSLPPSIVRKVERMVRRKQDEKQQQQMEQLMGALGGGMPGGAPGAESMLPAQGGAQNPFLPQIGAGAGQENAGAMAAA